MNEAKAIITGLFIALLIIVGLSYSGTSEPGTDLAIQPLPITFDEWMDASVPTPTQVFNNGEY